MSKLITNTIRHTGGSADNITLDGSQNVTCEANLQVDGNVTVTGTLPADKLTGTAAAINGSNITNLPAANLTGTLPAISGASLTGIPTRTTPFRNLIVNGAMNIAQRGTSSTTTGLRTIDRWGLWWGGQDEVLTHSQHALTSSDAGPWEKGFRNSFHITNGNQTSGAGAGDYAAIYYKVEAQDVAQSGWDYTNTNSKLTLSFWVKSSVAQTFYGFLEEFDGGSAGRFAFDTGALTANTWKKVTVTIPGHAGLVFNNDNGKGFEIGFFPFYGTNYTDSANTSGSWISNGNYTVDNTSTWWTTNDATWEITGVQLEVGDTATEFEHKLYNDELQRCYRYFYMHADGSQGQWASIGMLAAKTAGMYLCMIPYPTRMRTTPGLHKVIGTDYFRCYNGNGYQDSDDIAFDANSGNMMGLLEITDDIATSEYRAGYAQIANKGDARIGFDAEL